MMLWDGMIVLMNETMDVALRLGSLDYLILVANFKTD